VGRRGRRTPLEVSHGGSPGWVAAGAGVAVGGVGGADDAGGGGGGGGDDSAPAAPGRTVCCPAATPPPGVRPRGRSNVWGLPLSGTPPGSSGGPGAEAGCSPRRGPPVLS